MPPRPLKRPKNNNLLLEILYILYILYILNLIEHRSYIYIYKYKYTFTFTSCIFISCAHRASGKPSHNCFTKPSVKPSATEQRALTRQLVAWRWKASRKAVRKAFGIYFWKMLCEGVPISSNKVSESINRLIPILYCTK